MKTRESFPIRINGVSLLIMLILMCITVFAVLSLVSANSEYKLSQKAAQTQADSYLADAHAQQKLMLAQQLAAQARGLSGDYLENLKTLLEQNGFGVVLRTGAVCASFTTESSGNFAVTAAICLYADGSASVESYSLKNISAELAQGDSSSLWGA